MKRTALGMMLAVGVLLGMGANSFAVYYVDDAGGNDANNGATWGTAWKTVTNALTQAVAPSEIWVKAGTYYPTANPDTDRSKSITMKDGVDIYGGFAGTESSRGERNWSNNVTIFSGDIGTPSDPTDNSYHVVVGATARIDGFIIQDGRADDMSLGYLSSKGGGMYTSGSYPITANCIFSNNLAGSGNYTGGGAIYWEQGTYTACTVGWYNCTFDANVTHGDGAQSSYGGGLNLHFLTNTVGAISNCVFKNNVSTGGSSGVSALYLSDVGQTAWPAGAAFEVVDCLFSNNPSYSGSAGAVLVESFVAPVVFRDCQFVANSNYNFIGGAMNINVSAQGQGVQMTGCVFDRNYSGYTGLGGGAIYFSGNGGGTNAFYRNCMFRNNVSHGWGGGAIYGILDGTFDTCSFISNSSPSGVGGAIYNPVFGCVTNDVFTNCTFTANSAINGGAIDLASPQTFKNCAFTDNMMGFSGRGGAISAESPAGITNVISQCTFTGNGHLDGDNWTTGGGAIAQSISDMIITGSVFTQNKSHSFGGAIWNVAPTVLTASDCLFVSNEVAYGGGALYCGGPIKMMRSVLVGNNSAAYGGAIHFRGLNGNTGLVANCVFRDNRANAVGGAIVNENGHISISNVTFYTNLSATAGTGGALWNSTGENGATSLVVNCISWDNSPIEIGPTGGVTCDYSCIKGGFAGTGNISVDPLFADSIYAHEQSKNGYYDGGYFTGGTWLTSANNSPVIDAGDPASAFALEQAPNGGRINMGAYGNTELASKSRMIYSGTILQIR